MARSSSASEGHTVAGRSLLDCLIPLRATSALIDEHQVIQETLSEVLAVHATTHKHDLASCTDAARKWRENDASAAHLHTLRQEERTVNVLNRSCAVELENSALTVQVKDLLSAQGIQHPADLPQPPVFTEYNHEVLKITNAEGSNSSVAAAFWASDAAQQKLLRRCLDELKNILNDRELLIRERDWQRSQEELQKQRCFEAIAARDKKYETDTGQLKGQLERCQSELAQQRQLVDVLRARQDHDTAVQDVLHTLQNQTEGIAPTMQKTEQRHEALQQELQNAQAGFAQQVAMMQDVHAQVSVLGEVKRYKDLCEKAQEEIARVKEQLQEAQKHALEAREADAVTGQALQKEQAQLLKGLQDQLAQLQADRSATQELCDKERQETARVKEQLQKAQESALEARTADAAASQAVQREQAQLLQDLREQMTKLQAARNADEERAVKAEKEAADLREQLRSSQRDAQAATAATVRADAVAEQERLFSAHKEWISQQLQPLLQQPHPGPSAAPQGTPVHRAGGAGAAAQPTVPAAAGPSGASPPQPSSAAFLSEEEGNAADGAAAYADVGRLAQALSGREAGGAAAAVEEGERAAADAPQEDEGGREAGRVHQSTKRQGRPPQSQVAAEGSSAADAPKAAKKRAPRKSTGPPVRGGKRGRGGKQPAPAVEDGDDGCGGQTEAAGAPAQKLKQSRGRTAAAAAGRAAGGADEPLPEAVDARQEELHGPDAVEVGQTGDEGAVAPRRVLRARKPGLTMADDASEGCGGNTGSEGSAVQNHDSGRRAKVRRTSGAKQVANARKQPRTSGSDPKPRKKPSVRSPLLEGPDSLGSPRAMRMEDVPDVAGAHVAAAGGESPLAAAGDDAGASPSSDGEAGAAAVTWQDPRSTEFQPPSRTRPALAERPCHLSEQNVKAGGQRGTLGVHSVVGSQAGGQRCGGVVRAPNSMRDPETFGIVRNPMAAMTSKVMEATKAGRQKNAMSWGEKLAVKASERLRIGRPGYSSARVLSQSLSNSCVDAPTNELFPNGWKRSTLRH